MTLSTSGTADSVLLRGRAVAVRAQGRPAAEFPDPASTTSLLLSGVGRRLWRTLYGGDWAKIRPQAERRPRGHHARRASNEEARCSKD